MNNTGGALTKLHAKYNILLPSEKKVADYILDNTSASTQMSIDELAEISGTSRASVLRLCKKLNFTGFRDFKYSLIQDTVDKAHDIFDEANFNDNALTVFKRISQTNCSAINETLKVLDLDNLEKAAALIMQSNKIILFATGGSSVVAMDMYHKLLRLGYDCSFALDSRFQEMSARLMKSGDVAIGFTFSGGNKHVVNCLEAAGSKGANRICLTNGIDSPVTKVSDIILYAASTFKSKITGSLDSRIAQLNVIDGLFLLLVNKNLDTSKTNLEQTLEVLNQERVPKP